MNKSSDDVYNSLTTLNRVLRVNATASVCFVMGFLFTSESYLIPYGNYLLTIISLAIGIHVPFLASLAKIKKQIPWMASNIVFGLAVVFMINGYFLQVFAPMFLISCPSCLVFGFFHTSPGPRYEMRWRVDLLAHLVSFSTIMLGRFLRLIPFPAWNGLYVVAGCLFLTPLTLLKRESKKPEKDRLEASEEQAGKSRFRRKHGNELGMHGGTYFGLGIIISAVWGLLASVIGFIGDFAWIDPNPLIPGVPRNIVQRAYAPWDTIFVTALSLIITLFLLLKWLDNPRKILGFSLILLGGFAVVWWASWAYLPVPLALLSLMGFPLFLGSTLGLLVFTVSFFKPPKRDKRMELENKVSPQMMIRAWLVAVPFFITSFLGVYFRQLLDRNMDWLYLVVLLVIVILAVLSAVVGGVGYYKKITVRMEEFAYTFHGKGGKKARNSIIGAFLLFGLIYASTTTAYHDTSLDEMETLFMWGGELANWDADLTSRITHATGRQNLGTIQADGTLIVSGGPYNITDYHDLEIKLLPAVGLSGELLYHVLSNDTVQDNFISGLRNGLIAEGVDGVSIDFEGMITPAGAEEITKEDWIQLWERVYNEACHVGGNDFLFTNYWGIDAGYTRNQINRYFNAVDIHIQNMYEAHHHGGMQGSTTVIERSIIGAIAVHSMLDDKTQMEKFVPGLPVYHYIWIDGRRAPLMESDIIPGGRDWYFQEYYILEELLVNNSAVFRYDPFSGATYAKFDLTLVNGTTVTCAAWLHDTGHLAQTMHVMQGYGIKGMMFWPANQPFPPGFIETFYV
ncbi:MAG: hypothetical protein ACFFCS_25820 [Candidatus Hodarchaeota archaeon]